MTKQNTVSLSPISFNCIPVGRAVVDREWVFLSRETGYDYSSMTLSESLKEQTRQAIWNTKVALEAAGAGLENIVRIKYYISDIDDFNQVRCFLAEYIGKAKISATAIIEKLSEPKMKIEMDVTAMLANRW